MLLTGAFHEDGLADTSDALGGAYDREKIFVILKDSRIGAFGACALVVSIAGRAALLAHLGEGGAWALPLVGAAARVGPVWQIATMPVRHRARSREERRRRARRSERGLPRHRMGSGRRCGPRVERARRAARASARWPRRAS